MLVPCLQCKSPVFVSSQAVATGDVRASCAACGSALVVEKGGVVRMAQPPPGPDPAPQLIVPPTLEPPVHAQAMSEFAIADETVSALADDRVLTGSFYVAASPPREMGDVDAFVAEQVRAYVNEVKGGRQQVRPLMPVSLSQAEDLPIRSEPQARPPLPSAVQPPVRPAPPVTREPEPVEALGIVAAPPQADPVAAGGGPIAVPIEVPRFAPPPPTRVQSDAEAKNERLLVETWKEPERQDPFEIPGLSDHPLSRAEDLFEAPPVVLTPPPVASTRAHVAPSPAAPRTSAPPPVAPAPSPPPSMSPSAPAPAASFDPSLQPAANPNPPALMFSAHAVHKMAGPARESTVAPASLASTPQAAFAGATPLGQAPVLLTEPTQHPVDLVDRMPEWTGQSLEDESGAVPPPTLSDYDAPPSYVAATPPHELTAELAGEIPTFESDAAVVMTPAPDDTAQYGDVASPLPDYGAPQHYATATADNYAAPQSEDVYDPAYASSYAAAAEADAYQDPQNAYAYDASQYTESSPAVDTYAAASDYPSAAAYVAHDATPPVAPPSEEGYADYQTEPLSAPAMYDASADQSAMSPPTYNAYDAPSESQPDMPPLPQGDAFGVPQSPSESFEPTAIDHSVHAASVANDDDDDLTIPGPRRWPWAVAACALLAIGYGAYAFSRSMAEQTEQPAPPVATAQPPQQPIPDGQAAFASAGDLHAAAGVEPVHADPVHAEAAPADVPPVEPVPPPSNAAPALVPAPPANAPVAPSVAPPPGPAVAANPPSTTAATAPVPTPSTTTANAPTPPTAAAAGLHTAPTTATEPETAPAEPKLQTQAGNGISRDVQLCYARGNRLLNQKKVGLAIRELNKCKDIDPSYGRVYRSLGVAYMLLGRERSAILAYEKFVDIEPQHKDAPKVREIIADYYRRKKP